MNLITELGELKYETHGKLCEELVNAGYDISDYYDGFRHWGDFRRVLVMVSYIRGAKSYDEYLKIFETIKQDDDEIVSKNLYARLTGIKAHNKTQTKRTALYRQRNNVELAELRRSNALHWIDTNPDEAKEYLDKSTP